MLPTTNEWKVIKEITELLRPFEMATRLLSGQQYPTLSLIYPTILSLKNMLLTDFNHFKSSEAKLVRDKIEDLSTRWDYPEEMGIYAAFFDPCFKDLYFLDQVCIYLFFFLRKLKYLDFIYLFIYFIKRNQIRNISI